MSNQKRPTSEASGQFVLGRERFSKISAVEGVKLSRAMKRRQDEFDRKGLSDEEKRKMIRDVHRKG
jgi:hypothetical protein